MEDIEKIKLRVSLIGADYDNLKPFMKEYLKEIEIIIEEKFRKLNHAITVIKEDSISVSAIAKELNCSRTTLYNHDQFLKRYIELIAQNYDNENPLKAIHELRTKITKLQDDISLMYDRDIDNEALRLEVKSLQKTLKDKNDEVNHQRKRIEELAAEKQRLHKLVNKLESDAHNGTIVQLNNKE